MEDKKIIYFFLVPLASARCVSCLHALSLEPDLPGSLRFGQHKADVTIFTNLAFVAKNQRLESNPPLVMKSLRTLIHIKSGGAWQWAVSSAWQLFHLFLPYKLGQGDNKLRPDSVSRWIKSAVRQAYTSAGNSQFIRVPVGISAHEVRAIATSWAVFNSAAVGEILRAAYWNSETTFTSFYLCDWPGFS